MFIFSVLFRWLYRQGVRLLWLGLLLLTLYMLAGRILAPLPDSYRPEIEAWLSEQLQQEVSVGRLQVRWEGFGPHFYATRVRLGPVDDGLHIQTLAFRPDMLRSAFQRRWQLASLGLRGLELALQEQPDGSWQLQGLPMRAERSTELKLSWQLLHDSVQQLGRFSLANARIRVLLQDRPGYVLEDVNLSLAPGNGLHLLQAHAVLPDEQPLALRTLLALNADSWQQSAGNLYLQLPDSNWADWLPVSLLPEVQLQQARLAGRFWGRLEAGGHLQLVADLQGGSIHGSWQERPVDLQLGAAQLYARLQEGNWAFWSEQLPLTLQQQEAQQLSLHVDYRPAGEGTEARWQLALQQLELQPVMAAVQAAPMPELAREVVRQLDFTGQLHNLNARWYPQRPWQALEYDTNLQQLAWSPGFHTPGASGVSGRLQGTLAGGQLQLASPDGFSLHLDEVFAEPWDYHRAYALLDWTLEGTEFHLASPGLQVSGDEGEINGHFQLDLPGPDVQRESSLNLQVGMRAGNAAFTRRYLPRYLQEEQTETYDWLVAAIHGGQVHQGYYGYQGGLSDGTGRNRLYFDVSQAELAYQPGWPALREARVQVHVLENGVDVGLQQGRILNSRVGPARAHVGFGADGRVPALELKAGLQASLQDGLSLVQDTPLADSLPVLAGWQGRGAVPGQLELSLPLSGDMVPRVQLDLQLQDALLEIPEQNLKLEAVSGPLRIDSHQGLYSKGLQGSFLGQAFAATAAPVDGAQDWSAAVKAKGQMPVTALQQWLQYRGQLPLQGQLQYELELTLADKDSQLAIVSDLEGVEISLPRPLGKTAAQRVPTQWHMTLEGKEPQYWLTHGRKLSALLADDGSKGWRGHVMLDGRQPRLPSAAGIRVEGKLGLIDGAAWQAALEQLGQNDTDSDGLPVTALDLDIARLEGLMMPLDNLKLGLRSRAANRGWDLQLDASQIKGQIGLPADQSMQVNLQELHLPTGMLADSADSAFDPASIPAMQVQVEQVMLDGEPLGSWSFKAVPQVTGARLDNLQLGLKGLQLQGQLDWNNSGNSRFNGILSGEQLEEILQAWDYAPTVTAERFSLALDVLWPGGLQALSARELSGTASFRLRKGQLLALDGGSQALRVFGILNFDSIGRRLRLDFRDLLNKGLAYDRINGELAINRGVYQTRQAITLEGISSNLSLEGSADAHSEQLDAWMQVTMPISRNLPLVAVAAGAPLVGGALFVFDRLAGDRASKMAAVRYRLQGNWLDPEVSLSRELPPGAVRAEDAGE